MYIAIIADDTKKELMTQFCIAYLGILSRHNLCATQTTGKHISDSTGLDIELLLPGDIGGIEQIASRISCNEIDVLLYFRDPSSEVDYESLVGRVTRLCDIHNVPVATNIATAEALVLSLDSGILDWRELVNPNSKYNRK